MTAGDKRKALECLLWEHVGEPGLVGRILAASDAVVRSAVAEVGAGRGPGVVHFAGGGGRWSCRPWDTVMTGAVSLAAGDVTCGNCWRTPAWRAAQAEAGRPEWAVALDELLGAGEGQ